MIDHVNVREYEEFIRTRRSVRHFLSQPVPKEILERVLETATWAPSSHNRQPWRFVLIEREDCRARMAEDMGADFHQDLIADGVDPDVAGRMVHRSIKRIMEAPVVILLCLDTTKGDTYPDKPRQDAEYLMGVQSVALAGGTLLLAAHAEGLGGVWVCAPLFAPGTVRKALGLPEEWDPQGLLFLGYPARIPDPRPRLPLAEVVKVV